MAIKFLKICPSSWSAPYVSVAGWTADSVWTVENKYKNMKHAKEAQNINNIFSNKTQVATLESKILVAK